MKPTTLPLGLDVLGLVVGFPGPLLLGQLFPSSDSSAPAEEALALWRLQSAGCCGDLAGASGWVAGGAGGRSRCGFRRCLGSFG